MKDRLVVMLPLCTLLFFAAGGTGTGAADDGGGAALFNAGRYEEALRYYEEEARRSPLSPSLRHNLAHARAAYGQVLFLRGNFEGATRLVDDAIEMLPREHAFHLLKARISFDAGHLYEAMHHAEKAVNPQSRNPLAHEIIGDIFYQRGELNNAVASWKKASADGNSRAADKIGRADRERNAEGAFGRDVSVHFTLQYDGPVSKNVVRSVLGEMETLYDRIGDFVGSYPAGDIPVILYSRVLYREVTHSPLWAAGSFDGKIRVPVAGLHDEGDVRRIRPILAHELSHAFFRAVAPRGLPLWFEEGLAGHLEDLYGRGLDRSPGPGRAPFPGSFATLDGNLRGTGKGVRTAYRAALRSVRHIIEYRGDWSIRRILEKVGSGVPFAEALEGETGLPLQRLEEILQPSP